MTPQPRRTMWRERRTRRRMAGCPAKWKEEEAFAKEI